jgi:hypothetical protein
VAVEGVTVAVRLTGAPKTDGFGEVERVTVAARARGLRIASNVTIRIGNEVRLKNDTIAFR